MCSIAFLDPCAFLGTNPTANRSLRIAPLGCNPLGIYDRLRRGYFQEADHMARQIHESLD
jgi:hypothetical protein